MTSESESRLILIDADPESSFSSDFDSQCDGFFECLDLDPIERSLLWATLPDLKLKSDQILIICKSV